MFEKKNISANISPSEHDKLLYDHVSKFENPKNKSYQIINKFNKKKNNIEKIDDMYSYIKIGDYAYVCHGNVYKLKEFLEWSKSRNIYPEEYDIEKELVN